MTHMVVLTGVAILAAITLELRDYLRMRGGDYSRCHWCGKVMKHTCLLEHICQNMITLDCANHPSAKSAEEVGELHCIHDEDLEIISVKGGQDRSDEETTEAALIGTLMIVGLILVGIWVFATY